MLALYDKITSLYNYLLGYKIMTDVNYTAEMVATIEAAQPLDLAKAKALGAQLDRGYRSIIAKAKREGFEYISKPAPAKKKAAPSKADMVAAICAAVDTDSLDGLEKATGSALNKLLQSIAYTGLALYNQGLTHLLGFYHHEFIRLLWILGRGTDGNFCLHSGNTCRDLRSGAVDCSICQR